jgi:hypothetical protein
MWQNIWLASFDFVRNNNHAYDKEESRMYKVSECPKFLEASRMDQAALSEQPDLIRSCPSMSVAEETTIHSLGCVKRVE